MEKKEERARGGIVVYGMQGALESALVNRFVRNEYLNVELTLGISHLTKTVDGNTLDIFISKPPFGYGVKEHLGYANMAMLVMPCTANFADCNEFLQEALQATPHDNYKFIIVIDQSELIGTPSCLLTNENAKALLNSSDNIEALYWCSAQSGFNIENAFNHVLWNKEVIELPFFRGTFEAAKLELKRYKGFKESPDQIGPVKFLHSRCNSTQYLLEIITLFEKEDITQKSAINLARIIFDHYAIIPKINSELSLCLERILVGLFTHILDSDINREYQAQLQQRSRFRHYAKPDDMVYQWLITLCGRCALPPANETAIEILKYIQTLEIALNYKWGLTATQQRVEHLIKFACHFITQLYADQFNGVEDNLAQLRREYEDWAYKNAHIDTSKIAHILKIAHIRITHPERDSDEEMVEFFN